MSSTYEPDPQITNEFFELTTVDQLIAFRDRYRDVSPYTRALCYYIDTWLPVLAGRGQAEFRPGMFVSRDLSSTRHGEKPVVFMGTNAWASKRWLSGEEICGRVAGFEGKIREIVNLRDKDVAFLVVPEKDVVIDHILRRTETLDSLNVGIATLRAAAGRCLFLHDEFLRDLPLWTSADEYMYADSHLLSRDYFMMVNLMLQKLGFFGIDPAEFRFIAEANGGDLGHKFDDPIPTGSYIFPKSPLRETAFEISGHQTFAQPLGETRQRITNSNPVFDVSVEIFGDSHCSILSTRKMTYLFASLFREVTFSWNPFGVRGGDLNMTGEIVIMEVSERFVF